jgi:hypothetical protein
MAHPSEQIPAVQETPRQRPGLEPHVRKIAIFLSLAVVTLTFSVWMMAFVPKPACGILSLLGGALAFAALLHSMRKS